MAVTPSNKHALGTTASDFNLLDTQDNVFKSLSELKGKNGTLIFFICNHCPFVVHVNPELVALANHYSSQGISCIGISSNDVRTYPQDGPDKMTQHAKDNNYPFPYLYDATQAIAKAYDAACTPDFFLFDNALQLVYTGQLDDSRPGNNIPLTGTDIRNAIDNLLNKKPIDPLQKPSIGCNIKWKQNSN